MPPSHFATVRRLNRAAILTHRENDRCWANDAIIKATSAVLGIDIVIVDEREPHDRVQIALRAEAETPGFVFPTRSWCNELLPRLLQQQHELTTNGRAPATPLIVLHWVANRQHYEPALPIEPPVPLPSPPRSPDLAAKPADDKTNLEGDEQPEGANRPPSTKAARHIKKAPATRNTARGQEHPHTPANTTSAQRPCTRAGNTTPPDAAHRTTTEGQSPAPRTIDTRATKATPPSPQPLQAPAPSLAPAPRPRAQPREALHRNHNTIACATSPNTRSVTRESPTQAASTAPSHPHHTRTTTTPAQQRTESETTTSCPTTPHPRATCTLSTSTSPTLDTQGARPRAPRRLSQNAHATNLTLCSHSHCHATRRQTYVTVRTRQTHPSVLCPAHSHTSHLRQY